MLLAGITREIIVSPFRVSESLKVTAVTYCNLLNEVFDTWQNDRMLSFLRTLVFMNDNAISNSARDTKAFLNENVLFNSARETQVFLGIKMKGWGHCCQPFPISTLSKTFRTSLNQMFMPKYILWADIIPAAETVQTGTIKNDRLEDYLCLWSYFSKWPACDRIIIYANTFYNIIRCLICHYHSFSPKMPRCVIFIQILLAWFTPKISNLEENIKDVTQNNENFTRVLS